MQGIPSRDVRGIDASDCFLTPFEKKLKAKEAATDQLSMFDNQHLCQDDS